MAVSAVKFLNRITILSVIQLITTFRGCVGETGVRKDSTVRPSGSNSSMTSSPTWLVEINIPSVSKILLVVVQIIDSVFGAIETVVKDKTVLSILINLIYLGSRFSMDINAVEVEAKVVLELAVARSSKDLENLASNVSASIFRIPVGSNLINSPR